MTEDVDYWTYCANLEPELVPTEHTNSYDYGSAR